MEKVRLGMIGSQFAARLHLVNAMKWRRTKLDVVGLASQTERNAQAAGREFDVPFVCTDYRRLLDQKDIDVIDICAPTYLHEEMIVAAAEAGKHIICEKPLTGYFGKGEGVGSKVSRAVMVKETLEGCARIRNAVEKSRVLFCYAEDWIYAPPFAKVKRIVKVSGGTVMDMRGEESHSGSHAAYSRKWVTSGGGALMRVGSHPVGALLHLKAYEGQLRDGKPVRPTWVTGEVGHHTWISSFQKEPRKWMVSSWEDVEDWSIATITFEDGSHGTAFASDGVLGGTRKWMQVYLSNAVGYANMNPNTALQVYAPDPSIFGEEYIAEKLETKAGWSFASPDEDWMGGYPQQMDDFIECLLEGREPVSGLDLAEDTVKVIYGAYLSAEKGQKVELK